MPPNTYPTTPDLDQRAWDEVQPQVNEFWVDRFSYKERGWYPDYEYRQFMNDRNERRQLKAVVERLALENPELDYFEKFICEKPKSEIGQYVASQGFAVPVITDKNNWAEALADGTAMIRSEHAQDYSGLQGIHSSWWFSNEDLGPGNQWRFLTQAVRDGKLSEEYFMRDYVWPRDQALYYEACARVELPAEQLFPEYTQPDFSFWRFVPGLNIRIWQDPSQPERYFYGTRSNPFISKSSGFVTPEYYDDDISERFNQEVPAKKVIEYYDAIRNLSRFDQTNCPLLELQLDSDGNLHFLQYYKTRHSLNEAAEFELPQGDRFNYVRGATRPEGETIRLYLGPKRFGRRLWGQGLYSSAGPFTQQQEGLAGRMVNTFVSGFDISLRDTHAAASILYNPKVSICSFGTELDAWLRETERKHYYSKDPRNTYVNARITSNGREAVIEVDRTVHYDELA